MALRLLYGSSVSQKTEVLYDTLIRDASRHPERNFIIVVPEQASLQVQEAIVLRQQDKVIESSAATAERVHAGENKIRFDEDSFTTYGGGDEQTFAYSDIKLTDLTEEGIYVWMSDTMIMPIPLHAFRGMEEMKELYKWLRDKAGANE